MSEPQAPDPKTCDPNGSFLEILNCNSGVAADNKGQSANTLFAALAGSFSSFGLQMIVFMILRLRLVRIYRPRSYLVPEKERVPVPPRGLIGWLKPLFGTPNLAFIQKCGLDAYFFLRYLRMLLKIFVPLAVVILPILLPINRYSGAQSGLDRLSISNIAPNHTQHRLWAHLILALFVISWVCFVVYRELRGYIRVRQAFLTSPQHRIRASATTVLVTGIPRKWLTPEALSGLYDVFPGGIRNIWINRNFDELADKVTYRDSLAMSLEDAETNLIKMCWSKQEKAQEEHRKKEGKNKKSKQERQRDKKDADAAAESMAQGDGVASGDRHSTPHGIQAALHEAEEAEHRKEEHERQKRKGSNPLGIVGEGFGAIGQGLDKIGKGVGKLGRDVVGDVGNGFYRPSNTVDRSANPGNGFETDDELYPRSAISEDVPPTPPPKTPADEREARLQSQQTDGTADRTQRDTRPTSNGQHPFATIVPIPGGGSNRAPTDYSPQSQPDIRTTGPSIESKPRSQMEIEEPASHLPKQKTWKKVFKSNDRSLAMPSPEPHTAEEDEFPLNNSAKRVNTTKDLNEKRDQDASGSKWTAKLMFWKKKGKDEEPQDLYSEAFNKDWDEDQDEEPYWRRYLEPKERETMRVPIFSPTWCPGLPLIGKKVDRIYYVRRELARLNLEIETDQNDVERFPFMNSAFIQFNHQVAAHMACQSLSHHVPKHMTPRIVEISPDDVIWDNMSIRWWERYLRTGIVLAICMGLIILYAIPVTFTSLLSKISTLSSFKAFEWLNEIPDVIISVIEGILPPTMLAIILALVPVIFRVLVKQQGVPTGTARELGVQQWFFAFLFIQVFFVVTITGGLTAFISNIAENPNQIVSSLAQNLPKASNYFFNYLLVQALSNSASSLLQVAPLLMWFVLAPILDSTARAKWRRQTTLQYVQWGSFFPPFTNFAVIGIIYSVIAPLILAFMLIIYGIFWIVWRYNVLYVYQFRIDTGGLLFPAAVNQLFVGLYVMELCLVGFFLISRDESGQAVCIPQAMIMIVALLCTVLYQWLLNGAFKPLFQYLPITLEDEAVIRDEEFARAQASNFAPLNQRENGEDTRDIQDVLAERDQKEEDYEDQAVEREAREIEEHRRSRRESSLPAAPSTLTNKTSPRAWHQSHQNQSASTHQSWKTDRWRHAAPEAAAKLRNLAVPERSEKTATKDRKTDAQNQRNPDIEAQHEVGDVLFSGFADELEDLTPEERDLLVRYAFQHAALRARRPVVWIPRDKLGVSDDEIKRAKKMSTVPVYDGEKGGEVEKTNIWMSNEGTALNGQGKVVFRRSPPDFSNVDLIAL